MTDDQNAILTHSQRQFLRGENPDHHRQKRQAIRERLAAGVKDLAFIQETTSEPWPSNLRKDDLQMVRNELTTDQIVAAIEFLELLRDQQYPEDNDLEERVERVEDRLDGIETLLHTLVAEGEDEPLG